MTNAILLRSGVNRKVHAPFWSRVGRSDLPGLGNSSVWLETGVPPHIVKIGEHVDE
jgi:hypothetical protein